LDLSGRTTKRANGQIWKYCEPVGNHPMMTELLLQRAGEVAPNLDLAKTSLLIVAHGTDLNENSAVAAKREADKIRALGKYASVFNVYMEEPPLVSDWRKLTSAPNVVVVPFFISDGLHSYEDIPVLLGIAASHPESRKLSGSKDPAAKASSNFAGSLDPFDFAQGKTFARDDVKMNRDSIFQRNPYKIDQRSLFYARSIGTDARFADIIVEQANMFDGNIRP
jgi:sirohydrochlorin cobaltochelatase